MQEIHDKVALTVLNNEVKVVEHIVAEREGKVLCWWRCVADQNHYCCIVAFVATGKYLHV